MNLLWITDPHFPFLRKEQQSLWDKLLIESGSDGLLLGGDLAEAPALERWLSHVLEIYPQPIAFVTGNHDFYHASIAEIRSRLGRFTNGCPRLSIFNVTREVAPTAKFITMPCSPSASLGSRFAAWAE